MRLTSSTRSAKYTSLRSETSTACSARTASVRAPVVTGSPAARNMAPKASMARVRSRGARMDLSLYPDETGNTARTELALQTLHVISVLHHADERLHHEIFVEMVCMQRRECLRPVECLRHTWHLCETQGSHGLHEARHFACQTSINAGDFA